MPASRSFALSSAAPQHSSPFYQKHKMSLTQTYYLAHTARSKLSKEAARSEYDLRVLVGHANLLDGLMIELADAEREQENWFNQSVRTAQSSTTPAATKSTSITWADSLPPVLEDDSSSSSDESDESDEEMLEADEPVVTRRRAPTPTHASVTEMEVDESEDEDDVAEDEESDSDELALVRTDSRSSFTSPPSSPPELLHELETEDEEEEEEESATPPSPPAETFTAPAPQQKQSGHTMTVTLKQHDDFPRSARVPELYI